MKTGFVFASVRAGRIHISIDVEMSDGITRTFERNFHPFEETEEMAEFLRLHNVREMACSSSVDFPAEDGLDKNADGFEADVDVRAILSCAISGHDVDPGEYIDSHGNDDALSFCKRCGALDV